MNWVILKSAMQVAQAGCVHRHNFFYTGGFFSLQTLSSINLIASRLQTWSRKSE